MPKKGPAPHKLRKIKQVLAKNPKGLWVREIARQANLDKSLVSIYLAKYLNDSLEELYPVKGKLIKIVRLKNE